MRNPKTGRKKGVVSLRVDGQEFAGNVIPYVRGKVRSKSHELVIEEVTKLVSLGYKEVVLTGIHTGHYIDGEYKFADLLKDLIKIDGLVRLRISSIEINELTDEVLDIFKESKHSSTSLTHTTSKRKQSYIKRNE